MFKDDYKFANEKITASSDLKKRTLEKINKSNEFNYKPYMRYGLICASFLFVVTLYPTLTGNQNLTNDKSSTSTVIINEYSPPQTGVEEYYISSIAQAEKETSSEPEEKVKSPPKKVKPKKVEANEDKQPKEEPTKPKKETPLLEFVPSKKPSDDEEVLGEAVQSEMAVDEDVKSFVATVPNDELHFNELEEYVALEKLKDFTFEEGYRKESWDNEEIFEYLGLSPISILIPPDLAADLPENTPANQVVIFNKDDKIAYDTFHYTYFEPQLTKEINPSRRVLKVSVSKDKYPCDCELYMKEDSLTSIVNGNEVKLGVSKQAFEFDENEKPTAYFSRYVGEFMLNDVGYRVIADNLTQKEFTDVVYSIVVPSSDKEEIDNQISEDENQDDEQIKEEPKLEQELQQIQQMQQKETEEEIEKP